MWHYIGDFLTTSTIVVCTKTKLTSVHFPPLFSPFHSFTSVVIFKLERDFFSFFSKKSHTKPNKTSQLRRIPSDLGKQREWAGKHGAHISFQHLDFSIHSSQNTHPSIIIYSFGWKAFSRFSIPSIMGSSVMRFFHSLPLSFSFHLLSLGVLRYYCCDNGATMCAHIIPSVWHVKVCSATKK